MSPANWRTSRSTIFYWFVVLPLGVCVLASSERDLTDLMHANPDYQLMNSSVCLRSAGEDDRHLAMRCREGELVKLVRLLYGHSAATGRCRYLPGDCVTHLVASSNEVTCVGLSRCDVLVASRDHGRPIPGCHLPTTYVQASFQCIPESVVADVCDSSYAQRHRHHHHMPLRGYLRSPFYPKPYSDSADCTRVLTAPQRGQRVRLYVVDLRLETAGAGGCADWLHVFDGYRGFTLCGTRVRRLLATSARQQLQVRFHSNRRRRLKGFWLYYEVVPHDAVESSTTSASTSLTTTRLRHRDVTDADRYREVVDDSAESAGVAVTSFGLEESRATSRVVYHAEPTAQSFPHVAEALIAIIVALFVSISIILSIFIIRIIVRRRTSTTSLNQQSPPQHQLDQQQQQHARSTAAHGSVSEVDSTPKNNIEKSLRRQNPHRTAPSESGTNCSGGNVVCRGSPEGDSVAPTTPDNRPCDTAQNESISTKFYHDV